MKPTRRDIVNLLVRRVSAALDAQIATLRSNAPKRYDTTPPIDKIAIKEFRRRPDARKLLRALTTAGIKHEIISTVRYDGAVATGDVYVSIAEGRTHISFPVPTAVQEKAVASEAAIAEYQREIQRLQHRKSSLQYNDNGLIADVITDLVADGDEALQKLVSSVESKVMAKLEELK